MSPARQKAAAAEARREQLDYASFLEIILSDEVNRRADRRIELRLQGAGFGETCRLEDFDWSAAITLDRRLLNGDGVPNAAQRPRGDLASVLADAPPATSPTHILDAPAARARDAIAGPAWQPPEEIWGKRARRMVDRRYQGAGRASPPPVRPQACQCAVQQFKIPLARARSDRSTSCLSLETLV